MRFIYSEKDPYGIPVIKPIEKSIVRWLENPNHDFVTCSVKFLNKLTP